MRGKVEVQVADKLVAGITPACAGKSGKTDWTTMCRRDHPRVCGEKFCAIRPQVVQAGSPPRVRGKVNRSAKLLAADGITPACAGKRTRHAVKRHWSRDHPRVCGEKLFYAFYHVPCPGSPPRVRGNGLAQMPLPCLVRIAPACAGKRKSYSKHKKHHRDHPRVCGEKAHLQQICHAP